MKEFGEIRIFDIIQAHHFGDFPTVLFYSEAELIFYCFVWIQLFDACGHLAFHDRTDCCKGEVVFQ